MQTRHSLRLLTLFGLLLFGFVRVACAAEAAAERVHLVILHLNDSHGGLQAEANGGLSLARLATLANQARAENPGHVLFLHAGDLLSRGDPMTTHFGGDANFRVLEQMGIDALTPGNGDFYFGLANLLRLTAAAKFPVLHGNTRLPGGGAAPFRAAWSRELAGVRIGVVGVGRVALDHPSARDVTYLDPVTVLRDEVLKLRPQTDLLIALTHIGVDTDRRLAAQVPGIDLIVGGDSHTQLDQPIRVPHPAPATGETMIVQTGSGSRYLGRVDIDLQRDAGGAFRVEHMEAKLIPATAQTPEVPQVLAAMKPFRDGLDTVLFTARTPVLNGPSGANPVGKLAAEAVRVGTKADVALLDRGAVSAGLPAGPITWTEITRVHPWRNRVLLLTLPGDARLARALAAPDVIAAGCELRKAADGKTEVLVGGAPLAAERTYTVAVGEYLYGTTTYFRNLPCRDSGERVDGLLARELPRLP